MNIGIIAFMAMIAFAIVFSFVGISMEERRNRRNKKEEGK